MLEKSSPRFCVLYLQVSSGTGAQASKMVDSQFGLPQQFLSGCCSDLALTCRQARLQLGFPDGKKHGAAANVCQPSSDEALHMPVSLTGGPDVLSPPFPTGTYVGE